MASNQVPEAPIQEFYRPKEAAAFLRVAKSTFWRWVQIGKIAKGKKLSPRATVWRREDLLAVVP